MLLLQLETAFTAVCVWYLEEKHTTRQEKANICNKQINWFLHRQGNDERPVRDSSPMLKRLQTSGLLEGRIKHVWPQWDQRQKWFINNTKLKLNSFQNEPFSTFLVNPLLQIIRYKANRKPGLQLNHLENTSILSIQKTHFLNNFFIFFKAKKLSCYLEEFLIKKKKAEILVLE